MDKSLDELEIDFFRNLLNHFEKLDKRIIKIEERLNNLTSKTIEDEGY
jgi:uncharacterized protein YdcH (DUF465 family)